jgi:predicted HTH transcriptional regulator
MPLPARDVSPETIVQLQIRIPHVTREQLRTEAFKTRKSMTDLCREMIERGLVAAWNDRRKGGKR